MIPNFSRVDEGNGLEREDEDPEEDIEATINSIRVRMKRQQRDKMKEFLESHNKQIEYIKE